MICSDRSVAGILLLTFRIIKAVEFFYLRNDSLRIKGEKLANRKDYHTDRLAEDSDPRRDQVGMQGYTQESDTKKRGLHAQVPQGQKEH